MIKYLSIFFCKIHTTLNFNIMKNWSLSLDDSLSQKEKKKKRKPNGNASTSKQKKCKEATKIPETADSPVTNAVRPPVNVLQPGIIRMQMQAIYPNYGLHGGESSTSCAGLLAQVMNVAGYGQQQSSQSCFYSAQTD